MPQNSPTDIEELYDSSMTVNKDVIPKRKKKKKKVINDQTYDNFVRECNK